MSKELTLEIKKVEILFLLIILSVVFYLDFRTTLKTPINFGDEGFHTRIAQWIAQEKDYFAWSPLGGKKPIDGFDRPPLWNLTEAAFFFIFGFNEIIAKILPPLIAFFTGILIYLMVKQLYNKETAFLASIISVTVPSFVTYSVLLYTDVLFTFYFSLFVFSLMVFMKKNDKKYLLISCIFAGFSILTKLPGISSLTILSVIFLYDLFSKKTKLIDLVKFYIPFLFLVLIITSGFLIRNIYYFKTPMCGLPIPFIDEECEKDLPKFDKSFPQRTEEIGTETNVLKMGLINYLSFAYGYIWVVVFGFCGGILLILAKKEKSDIILLLVLLGTAPLLFQKIYQRAEDTARYLLMLVPLVSLLASRYFSEIYFYMRKSDTILVIVTLIVILIPIFSREFNIKLYFVYLGVFGIILYFGYSSKNIRDYASLSIFLFIILFSFIHLKQKNDIMFQVKQFSPMYFKACEWIKENTPKDSVIMTIWSNRAIYNCQRNVMGNIPDISLSTDVNYTLNKAKEFGVTHIFLHKFSLSNEPMAEKYTVEFASFLESHPEHFVNIFENGPKLDECLQMGGCDGNIVYEVRY
ncbi:MAG: glycosyltransferase family 39 protein [Candidatus Aenigmatarchaeota archaeon]